MIIRVDRAKCAGHAVCALLDEELFPIDDEGYSIADGKIVPPGMEQRAQRVVTACPEGAISLE
jgi:ferredoxin